MIAHRVASFIRRNAATIPLVVISICTPATFFILSLAYATLSDQVSRQNQILVETKSIAQQIRDDSASRDKQIDDLNRHLDCIVRFFAQRDRSNSSIENIQTCRITKNPETSSASPSGSSGVSVAPRGTDSIAPTVQQPATQPKQPSQGGASGGGTSTPPSNLTEEPVSQLLQNIISLPLALIRQIPIVGGKP